MRKKVSILARIGLALMLILMLLPMTAIPASAAVAAGQVDVVSFGKLGTDGVTVTATNFYRFGATATVILKTATDADAARVNTAEAIVTSTSDPVGAKVTMTETDLNTAIYKGDVVLYGATVPATTPPAGQVLVNTGDALYVTVATNAVKRADGTPSGRPLTAPFTQNSARGTSTIAAGAVATLVVTAGGTGYIAVPAVTIVNAPGDTVGAGATATATIAGGTVTALTVTAGGAGYTIAPIVQIAPPTGTASLTGIDNLAPLLTITTPVLVGVGTTTVVDTAYIKNATGTNYFTVNVTATDTLGSGPGSVDISVDGGTTYNPSVGLGGGVFSYNWVLPADGTFAMKIRVTDAAGNIAVYPDDYDKGGATAPVVSVSAPNGTTATATATVAGGVITGYTVVGGGSGYAAAPAVTVVGTGCTGATTATATLTADVVTAVAISGGANGTAGCTAAAVTIAGPVLTQAVPGALTLNADGGITAIALGTAGLGYASAPTVTITDDRGTGAVYATTIAATAVTGYVLGASAGAGYDAPKRPFGKVGAGASRANAVSVKVDNTKPTVSDGLVAPAKAHKSAANAIKVTAKIADATAGIDTVTVDLATLDAAFSNVTPMFDDGPTGLHGDATKSDGVYTAFNRAGTSQTVGDITVGNPALGVYNLTITVKDKSANSNADVKATVEIVTDVTAPTATSVGALGDISGAAQARMGAAGVDIGNGAGNGDKVNITVVATDDLAVAKVSVDVKELTNAPTTANVMSSDAATDSTAAARLTLKSGTTNTWTGSFTVPAPDTSSTKLALGTKTVTLTVTDYAGLTATKTGTISVVGSLTSFSLKLAVGWNLVSLPMAPVSSSIVDTFDSVKYIPAVTATATRAAAPASGGVTRITAFFGSENRWRDIIWTTQWSGTPGFGDTGLVGGQAYFIESRTAVSLTIPLQSVSALDTPPTYSVPAGWSLVPYVNLGLTKKVQAAKDYVKGLSVIALYKFDATAGVPIKLTVGDATTAGDNVEMGQGYWIYVDKAGVLVP